MIEWFVIGSDFVGKVLLAVMALMVHSKVTSEGKIDQKVLGEMKIEQYLGYLAIGFFVLGFVLEMIFLKGDYF